jgi:hypothetical protein
MPFKEPLLEYMKKNQIPETRQNYLNLNYFGQVPDPIPAEEESELPNKIRYEKQENKTTGERDETGE